MVRPGEGEPKEGLLSSTDMDKLLAAKKVRVQDGVPQEGTPKGVAAALVVGPGVSFAKRLRDIGGRLGYLLNRNRAGGN